MDEESTRLLFAALERAGWKWESGSIMSPHGGIWFGNRGFRARKTRRQGSM